MTKRTVVDYLKEYGHLSFHEKAFSIPDAMLLCNMTYVAFGGVVPSDENTITFKEAEEKMDKDYVFSNPIYGQMYRELFDLMKESRRFKNIKLCFYREINDKSSDTQFGAITFIIGKNRTFVAFMGTDGSICGWKEDFNYAYLDEMPSQALAVDYLKEVAGKTTGLLYVGGHSKGGTLAIFSSAKMDPSIQERIIKIFSFDGIGFKPEFYKTKGFLSIQKRICKIVPEESFVGRLFTMEPEYHIVKSYESGMLQHDFWNWEFEDDHLVYLKKFPGIKGAKAVLVNRWVNRLEKEQIRNFIITLFGLLEGSTEGYVDMFFVNPMHYSKVLLRKFFELTKKERSAFVQTALKFL